MSDDPEVAAQVQNTQDDSRLVWELDTNKKLIELVEEHTLQVLNGKLLPVPVACLRCEQHNLDQSVVMALIEGTVRACKKHLAQCASEVKDFGPISTLRRSGLDNSKNALHQAVARALQAILQTILKAKNLADDMDLLALAELKPVPSHTRQFLTSATFEDVYRVYDQVARELTSYVGKQPLRDQMAPALSQYLGKNVSAGQVTKVRQAKGIDRKRAPKLEKVGFAQAEERAAEKRHKDATAEGSDFTSEVDRQLDQDEARVRYQTMTLRQQECEAVNLHVPLPLPEDPRDRIDLLSKAKALLESLNDLSERDLVRLAKDKVVPTEGQPKQSLMHKLMPILLTVPDRDA